MGQSRSNPRSSAFRSLDNTRQTREERDAARLRRFLTGCMSEGELVSFVCQIASPRDRAKTYETLWPLTTFGANAPFPGWPAVPASH